MGLALLKSVETVQFVLRELQRARGHVRVEVVGVAGARDGEDVAALVKSPGQSDLRGCRVVCACDGEYLVPIVVACAWRGGRFAARAAALRPAPLRVSGACSAGETG